MRKLDGVQLTPNLLTLRRSSLEQERPFVVVVANEAAALIIVKVTSSIG